MFKKIIGKLQLHTQHGYFTSVNGKRRYAGKKAVQTEEEAELWYAHLRIEYSTDEQNKPIDPNTQTYSALLTLFLAKKKPEWSDQNYIDHTYTIGTFNKMCGHKTPATIVGLDILDWLNGFTTRGSGGGKAKYHTQLKGAFTWLCNMLGVTKNPMAGSKRPPCPARRLEYAIPPDKWGEMLSVLPHHYRGLASVLYDCGARPAEIFMATIDEWDSEHRTLTKKTHKRAYKGQHRAILMPTYTALLVNQAIGGRTEGYIWDKNGAPYCEKHFLDVLKTAARKVGRSKPTIVYSTRHSFAVNMLAKGFTMDDLSDLLGNSIEVCEAHYGHGKETVGRLLERLG